MFICISFSCVRIFLKNQRLSELNIYLLKKHIYRFFELIGISSEAELRNTTPTQNISQLARVQLLYLNISIWESYFLVTSPMNADVDHLSSKAIHILNFHKQNFSQAPTNLKETLYILNVCPILGYACAVWDLHIRHTIQQLEYIQKWTARFVFRNYNFSKRSSEIRRNQLEDREGTLRSLYFSTY